MVNLFCFLFGNCVIIEYHTLETISRDSDSTSQRIVSVEMLSLKDSSTQTQHRTMSVYPLQMHVTTKYSLDS